MPQQAENGKSISDCLMKNVGCCRKVDRPHYGNNHFNSARRYCEFLILRAHPMGRLPRGPAREMGFPSERPTFGLTHLWLKLAGPAVLDLRPLHFDDPEPLAHEVGALIAFRHYGATPLARAWFR